MLSDEHKKNILEGYLYAVFTIADKNLQKRVWIKKIGPEVVGYDETFELLDNGIESATAKYKDYGISEEQRQLMLKFNTSFEEYFFSAERPLIPEEYIQTSEWEQVVRNAKEVVHAFNYKPKRGLAYWTKVFFGYIRYYLGKLKT